MASTSPAARAATSLVSLASLRSRAWGVIRLFLRRLKGIWINPRSPAGAAAQNDRSAARAHQPGGPGDGVRSPGPSAAAEDAVAGARQLQRRHDVVADAVQRLQPGVDALQDRFQPP